MIMRTDIEARGAVKRKEIRLVPENSIMSVLASVGELQSTYGRCVVAKNSLTAHAVLVTAHSVRKNTRACSQASREGQPRHDKHLFHALLLIDLHASP